jgi:hypothetical protein
MDYSEADAVNALYHQLCMKYSQKDIREIYRMIQDLIEHLTGHGKFAFHYNKYTIIMNCLKRFYNDYPHGKEIVHSYSSYISEQLHQFKQDEMTRRHEKNRKSVFCKYCVIS